MGGRAAATAAGVDLGGSWFFDGAAPAASAVASSLGLTLFPQPGGGPMRRLAGGLPAMVKALQEDTAAQARALGIALVARLGWRLTKVERSAQPAPPDDAALTLTFAVVEDTAPGDADVAALPWPTPDTDDGRHPGGWRLPATRQGAAGAHASITIGVRKAVLLAVPPRLAATKIVFAPPLPRAQLVELRAQPTWMAATGKVAFTYALPWWRSLPSEYDIHALRAPGPGPIVQLMDASTHNDGAYVLVAFVAPRDRRSDWRGDATAQMERLTGSLQHVLAAPAGRPTAIHAKLWAADENTFCAAPPGQSDFDHPEPLAPETAAAYGGRLLFCASEMSAVAPGYIEGAVHAGSLAARAVLGALK